MNNPSDKPSRCYLCGMKRALLTLIFSCVFFSCTQGTLFNFKETAGSGLRVHRKHLRLIAFFVNDEFSWYGEADRFHGKFYEIQPVVNYFNGLALTRLGVNFQNQSDYASIAKEWSLDKNVASDRKAGEGHLVYSELMHYYPFFKRLSRPDDFYLIVENRYDIILHGSQNRAGLLTTNALILNQEGDTVWSRSYSILQPLGTEDYRILVSFRGYDKNMIQKRAMELFSEAIITSSDKLVQDLKLVLQ